MGHLRLLVVLGLVACKPPYLHGGGDDGTGPDAPADDSTPLRSCTSSITYHGDAGVTAVDIVGAWDWSARTALADPDHDGTFTGELELAPGIWPYKLVVGYDGGGVDWVLDPQNPYRAYDGGVENSALRVADCAPPLLEVISHDTNTTRVRVSRGKSAAAITDIAVTLQGAPIDFTRSGGELTIATPGLAAGKYTLRITAKDAAGASAEPVLVPFWIEADPFDWRDALIYMVMTDRFRDGDPTNNPAPSAGADPGAEYKGGDLRGVASAIEDGTFDALGVRALWLSPFVANTTRVEYENGHGVTAFHGYWPVKARAIDPRLGSEADLDALVAAAHKHGIRVLMDFVINHVHEQHEYYAAHPDWFRTGCECGTPGCDWTEHRLDCSFHPYMPDVNWQNKDAGEQMIADAEWWLERFDLDGLRVDAVKHVEDLAISNLSTRIHERFETGGTEYYLLGETAMGWGGDDINNSLNDYATIARYIGPFALSGQFDFVLYHATTTNVFADEARGMLHLDYWTKASLDHYPADAVMSTYVGSHDTERLVSLADLGSGSTIVHHKWASDGLPAMPTTDLPYDRAAFALQWLLTTPGAPLLYYGDEYGEHGGADPDNRHMWAAPSARTPRQRAMFDKVARAGKLRQTLEPLRRGAYVQLNSTDDVLAFARVTASEAAIIVANHAATARTLTVHSAPIGNGTLTDRLDPGSRTVDVSNGSFTITMPPRSVSVLTH
ncbi:MAG TPA: alpha-amylase family glycosyl hydrolase [Kofleriaceae bacterium]|nr:alpha-amylase family glycosyl hydrolase [Kofleriaceae bacterium]